LTLPESVQDPKRFFFRPEKKGYQSIDILPYRVTSDTNPEAKAGTLWYQRTIWVHYGIGPEERPVICPKTIGQPCPICEERRRMEKEPDSDEEACKALLPKERELFNIVDLADPDAGVKIFEISYHLFGKKLAAECAENPDDRSGFCDLTGGKTLKLRFSEKTLPGRTFLEVDRIDFEDRGDYGEDWLDAVHDLDAMIKAQSYTELQRLFLQVDGESETPKESPAAAPVRPARPAAPPAPVVPKAAAPAAAPKPAVARRAPPPVKAPPAAAPEEPVAEEPQQVLDGIPCPACAGSGKNSKGNPCYPCKGTGQIVEENEEQAPPTAPKPAASRRPAPTTKAPPTATKTAPAAKPAAKPVATRAPKAAPAAPAGAQECPSGGSFGDPASCDNLPGCEACQNWPDCRTAADAQG